MRARMALLVSGTVCELREVKLADKPQAMIDASPKATVPVLVLGDGQVLDESLDIMLWALGNHDPEKWLEGDPASLIETNDGAFKYHLDRYKYATRYDTDPIEHRTAAVRILLNLEERLSHNINLLRDERSLSDIAILPFIRQFAEADRAHFDSLPLPRLQSWVKCHIQSPLFCGAMVRLAPWQPGQAPVMLGSEHAH
ncbi:glutathione S-transferase [Sphingobium sp. SCG-1]|nr:glutathione S-transferase [Sphingobium sp. SCG-1]